MSDIKPLLALTDVGKAYVNGENVVNALKTISFEVYPGEFVAIMGQSGSGKTTLMNILGCLDTPTHGSYTVRGTKVAGLGRDALATLRRETFGFIFQRYNLLATASAEENVEIPAIYAGVPREERLSRARELLAHLGLGGRAGHRPGQLSGGQQQRVAIARALMNNPDIILADEPTGALDSQSGKEVMALLKKLNDEGRTIILITHDAQVAAYARRVIHIQDGELTQNPPPKLPKHKHDTGDLFEPHHEGVEAAVRTIKPEMREAVKTATRALRVNFFRTALTLLGIVIGVAAVVTMLAVGNGSKDQVVSQISAMGTNLLNIRPGAPGVRDSGDNATLSIADADALSTLPNVGVAMPERQSHMTVRYRNQDYATTIDGVGESMPLVRDWGLAQGTFFTRRDVNSYAPVAVLGQTVVNSLMPGGGDPVGQYILIGNIPFQVIGVMATKGSTAWGQDQDDAVFVPVTTGLVRLFGQNYINSITLKVNDVGQINQTQDAMTKLLTARHHAEDFHVFNMASLLDMVSQTQNTLTILLGTVAAISLLVGGIGVMNIMLVSVTERTREIGIRMATGARMRDIMLQFNIEAAVVCTIGGLMGVVLGVLIGFVISRFGVAVVFTAAPALLAFCCAVATGLVFGYLPARKAARLDPVVALSVE